MSLYFSDDWEPFLDQAAKIDEQLYDFWMDICATKEYAKIVEFFDASNYRGWDAEGEEEEFEPEVIIKNLKRVLVGTDRIALIKYAFLVGRLVGRAEYTLLHEND